VFDSTKTIRDLKILHQAAPALEGSGKDSTAEFIRVGEYGLALDGIAYAYLATKMLMPADLFRLFEELAETMKLDRDPEYAGVAELRATQKAKL